MNNSKHIEDLVKEMERLHYSYFSIKNYKSNLLRFFEHFSKKEHPLHINESDIKDYLWKFKEANTQRSHHGAIKLFYEVCLHQKDKFKYIPYCEKSKKLPIVLSTDEVQKMFNVCENKKHKLILGLLYSMGLRVSELINLKWKHIDRSRMIINIIQAKGAKDRQVPLSPQLIPLLENYYREYKSVEYVLNGQKKEQYTSRSVLEVVKQIAAKAGLTKRVYTHLMRHNSFTHMAESGVDINLIQKIAGHSSVKTTNIYLHLSDRLISSIQSPLSQMQL